MRFLLILGFCLSLAGLSGNLFAQAYKNPGANYTPQSPNAAALGRFGEHPVNLFTGVPSISIPIYEIAAGSINIPVSLDYHAGGHKVTDMASWVGLGWALSGGASINRSVTGVPDEGGGGILSRPLNTTLSPFISETAQCGNVLNEYQQYFNEGGTPVWDTGYDIFSYSLPGGKNGKFILVRDDSLAISMPYERLKIIRKPLQTGSLAFTIVDETGVSYTFFPMESVTTNDPAIISTWQITEIKGTRPTERVQFSYTSSSFNGYSDFIDRIAVITSAQAGNNGGCSVSPGSPESRPTTQQLPYYSSVLLSEIVFPGGKLTMVPTSANRGDVPLAGSSPVPALDRIELYGLTSSNTYQLIKRFDLIQSYSPLTLAQPGDNSYLQGPLRLDALAMQDADGVEVGRYSCTYNTTVKLPGFLSRARDTWGYFNGATGNTTLIPSTPVTYYYPGGSSIVTVGSANRASSEANMQAGVLTQLTYPTKGYSKFFYEANRYLPTGGTNPVIVGGLRIVRIETQASGADPVRVKTYKYGTSGEDGNGNLNVNLNTANWMTSYQEKVAPDCQTTTTVVGSFYNGILSPFDGSPVTYPTVTEYQGTYSGSTLVQNANGRTVNTFRTYGSDQYYTAYSGGKQYAASYYWDRGQLESKTVYGQTGNVVYKLVNTYTNPIRTEVSNIGMFVARNLTYTQGWKDQNPRTSPGPCQELMGYTPPRLYPWPKGNIRLARTDEYWEGTSQPTSTTTTYNRNFQDSTQYTLATDGTITVRQFRYPHDYSIPTNPTGSVKAIKILQDNNQRNTVLEEFGYKQATASESNPVMTDGKITLYQELSGLPGQAFPKEMHELQVLGGSTRRSSFTPAAVTNATTLTKDPLYSSIMFFSAYDGNANLTQYNLRNGITTQLEWLTLSGTNSNLFSTLQKETKTGGTNSLVTQYGYDVPMIGPKSVTDPKGIQTNYAYDRFGRLDYIRDYNANLVQSFDYNYASSGYNTKVLTTPTQSNLCSSMNPYLVTGTFASGSTSTYGAQIQLQTQSTVTVQSGATLQVKAGQSIRLLAGFRAISGSSFSAQIAACTP